MRAGNTKLSLDFVCSLQNGYQFEWEVKCTVAGEMFTRVLAFGGLVWCSGLTASHTSN